MHKSVILGAMLLCAISAHAQVAVADAWVRTTVAQQTTTGAFMTLTWLAPARAGKLVAASSPIAADVQLHEMTMQGDMMKMRHVDALVLPAGKPVELKPGAYHLMMTGLKTAVKAGDVVPISLVIEDAGGRRETVEVKAVAKLN